MCALLKGRHHMFETTGKITREVMEEILAHKRTKFRTIMIWAVFAVGLIYLLVALFKQDWFGAAMAAIMAYLGYNALFARPRKWMKAQLDALETYKTDGISYKTSYANDCVNITCLTNGWKGTLAYSNFKRGMETEEYLVLFTFKDEYVITFKKQLSSYDVYRLKEHLKKKLPKKFRWTCQCEDSAPN